MHISFFFIFIAMQHSIEIGDSYSQLAAFHMALWFLEGKL